MKLSRSSKVLFSYPKWLGMMEEGAYFLLRCKDHSRSCSAVAYFIDIDEDRIILGVDPEWDGHKYVKGTKTAFDLEGNSLNRQWEIVGKFGT